MYTSNSKLPPKQLWPTGSIEEHWPSTHKVLVSIFSPKDGVEVRCISKDILNTTAPVAEYLFTLSRCVFAKVSSDCFNKELNGQ